MSSDAFERLVISDEVRKRIYSIRVKRRELRDNPPPKETDPEKIEKERIIDECMRKLMPSYYELKELDEKAAYSSWFAASELERIESHIEDFHKGDTRECKFVECLEDITREDVEEYLSIIMAELERIKEEEKNEVDIGKR